MVCHTVAFHTSRASDTQTAAFARIRSCSSGKCRFPAVRVKGSPVATPLARTQSLGILRGNLGALLNCRPSGRQRRRCPACLDGVSRSSMSDINPCRGPLGSRECLPAQQTVVFDLLVHACPRAAEGTPRSSGVRSLGTVDQHPSPPTISRFMIVEASVSTGLICGSEVRPEQWR